MFSINRLRMPFLAYALLCASGAGLTSADIDFPDNINATIIDGGIAIIGIPTTSPPPPTPSPSPSTSAPPPTTTPTPPPTTSRPPPPSPSPTTTPTPPPTTSRPPPPSPSPTAEPVFTFGSVSMMGTGCPKDSVKVVTSSNAQSVSILYSNFTAATSTSATRDRKTCNLAIPVTVKPGHAISVYKLDYRGNADVPKETKGYAEFNTESFFAGQRVPVTKKRYEAGASEDVKLTSEVDVETWSECGSSTNFRINSNLIAFKASSPAGQEVKISMDTLDAVVERGVLLHVKTRGC